MDVHVNMSVYGNVHKSVVPTEASRGPEVRLQEVVSHLKWVLATKFTAPARAARALNRCAVPPAPESNLRKS